MAGTALHLVRVSHQSDILSIDLCFDKLFFPSKRRRKLCLFRKAVAKINLCAIILLSTQKFELADCSQRLSFHFDVIPAEFHEVPDIFMIGAIGVFENIHPIEISK